MAVESLSLDDFNAAYLQLRVDYLRCDELDYELNSRGVFVPPESDPTGVQRCRRLREMMNSESEKSNGAIRRLPGDAVGDLVACHGKINSIKEDLLQGCSNKEIFRSRLLHLGARLQIIHPHVVGLLKETTLEKLDEVFALYTQHFNQNYIDIPEADPLTTEEDGEIVDDLSVSDTASQDQYSKWSEGENLGNQVAGNEIFAVLLEIRAEIQDLQQRSAQSEAKTSLRNETLEDTLQKFNSGVATINSMASALKKTLLEVETLRKTVSDLQSIVVNVTSNVNGPALKTKWDNPCLVEKPTGVSNKNQHTLEGFLNSKDLQKRFSEPARSPENLKPHKIIDSGMVNTSKTFGNVDPEHQLRNPQVHSSLPNFTSPNGWKSKEAVEIPAFYGQHQRVADWKIQKYAGNDEGIGLNEFLETVHHYAELAQISEEDLFNSALHLFTGNALVWYQSMRSQKRLFNWNHLVCELKANFVNPELDAALKIKASQRRQQKDESFQEYYLHMEKLFSAITAPLTRREKLEILKRNLRTDYKQVLTFQPVNTLAELISLGKSVDASTEPIYQKVFGNFRETSTSSVKPATDGYKQTKPQQENHRTNTKTRIFWNRSGRPPSPEISKPSGKQMDQNLPENTQKAPRSTQTHKQVNAIDYLVDNHRPPGLGVCYNCEGKGHSHETCPLPSRVFCVICGFEGCEHSQCPYCLKHGIRSD